MRQLLAEIEAAQLPAHSPIEQRWTASSSSPMSPAAAGPGIHGCSCSSSGHATAVASLPADTIHSWVGIIMYLPTDDEAARAAIAARCGQCCCTAVLLCCCTAVLLCLLAAITARCGQCCCTALLLYCCTALLAGLLACSLADTTCWLPNAYLASCSGLACTAAAFHMSDCIYLRRSSQHDALRNVSHASRAAADFRRMWRLCRTS